MDHLIAILVMVLFGPPLIALTIATLVAIPVGLARFDLKAARFMPGAGQFISRIYVIASAFGFLTTVMLLVGGLLAILWRD